jgi:alpha-tubulin suppressor-like RCC1 family protein
MAGEFQSPSGNLENILVSDYNMIDQYIGGSLWIWGDNSAGELGTNNTTNRLSPVQTVSAGTNWEEVALGYEFAATIKTDGTLWTWGSNNNGRLGDNTTTNRSSPVQTSLGGTNWYSVSAGGYHTLALKTT